MNHPLARASAERERAAAGNPRVSREPHPLRPTSLLLARANPEREHPVRRSPSIASDRRANGPAQPEGTSPACGYVNRLRAGTTLRSRIPTDSGGSLQESAAIVPRSATFASMRSPKPCPRRSLVTGAVLSRRADRASRVDNARSCAVARHGMRPAFRGIRSRRASLGGSKSSPTDLQRSREST
jgi:hypothetical protein